VSLADLNRVEVAGVWKAGKLAARLTRGPNHIAFAYKIDYAGPPISVALPRLVGDIWLHGGALPPFFSGLLPERCVVGDAEGCGGPAPVCDHRIGSGQ
jgi:serine/threonine-protein kinase HipA